MELPHPLLPRAIADARPPNDHLAVVFISRLEFEEELSGRFPIDQTADFLPDRPERVGYFGIRQKQKLPTMGRFVTCDKFAEVVDCQAYDFQHIARKRHV